MYIAALAACILLDITLITVRVALWPSDVDHFREIEKVPEFKARLEEAAAEELQQGWQKGKGGGDGVRKSESESSTTPIAAGAMEEGRRSVGVVSGRGAGGAAGEAGHGGEGQAAGAAEPRSSLHSPSMETSRLSFADRESHGGGGAVDHDVLLARRFGSVKR